MSLSTTENNNVGLIVWHTVHSHHAYYRHQLVEAIDHSMYVSDFSCTSVASISL